MKLIFHQSAAADWEKVQGGNARQLLKFIEDWSPAPATEDALTAYDVLAAEGFNKTVSASEGRTRLSQLKRFLSTWRALSPTVVQARTEIDKLIVDEYQTIMKEKMTVNVSERLRHLLVNIPTADGVRKRRPLVNDNRI